MQKNKVQLLQITVVTRHTARVKTVSSPETCKPTSELSQAPCSAAELPHGSWSQFFLRHDTQKLCVIFFSLDCDKVSHKSNLRKEGLLWVLVLKGTRSIMPVRQRGRSRSHLVTLHLWSESREKYMLALSLPAHSSLFIQPTTPALGVVLPAFR